MEKYHIKKISDDEEIEDLFILLYDYPYITNWQLLIEKNRESIFLLKNGEMICGIFGIIFITEEYFSNLFFKQIDIFNSKYFFLEQYMIPFTYKNLNLIFDQLNFLNVVILTHIKNKKKKLILSNLEDEKYQSIFKKIEVHRIYKTELFFSLEKSDFLNLFN